MLMVERMVKDLRVRVCNKLRKAELPFIETLGKGQLYTTISQDANLISQSAFVIIHASQGAIMVVFAMLYIFWLSPLAFFIILGAVGVALLFYYYHRKSLLADLGSQAVKDAEFLDSLGHMVDGFKEAKLNRRKNDSLFAYFSNIANATEELKVSVGLKVATDVMFSQVFFSLLIGVIVFLLPRYVPTFNVVVLQMTAAVLFIVAPLEMIVNAMPMLARANVAIDNLYGLERRLDKHLEYYDEADETRPASFKSAISLKGAAFTYHDAAGAPVFGVGPIDLEVKRGEILFVTGGNGSGKSTLLKILTGLYPLESGVIRLDRQPVLPPDVPSYRELFSAIFTDFHLFDRFYGLEGVDEKEVVRWIDEMELSDKTGFKNGKFTNLNLSTGQKKRLALIIALLEDREIYVFDEWAADQDVHFREHFYHVILKDLKDRGKTVVAVTHDDRFWDVSDRRVHMEGGEVVLKEDGAPRKGRAGGGRKKGEKA
jgi:putative ATP-binding cassette transporter